MASISHFPRKEPTFSELDWIDQRVKAFERQWRADDPSRWIRHLEDAGELRPALLMELLHVDLEFSFRHGLEPGVDSYLGQFPELTDQSMAVANLLLHEWKLQQLRRPDLSLDELLSRYPGLQYAVRDAAFSAAGDSDSAKEQAQCQTTSVHDGTTDNTALDHRLKLPGYEFKEVLGRGGMGIVYRALDLQLKREVAIKMLLKGALATPQEQTRFRREAEAVAALQHSQVLQVYQIGEHQGQPYLVLEFASGGSLNRQLNGRPMEARRAAEIMRGLARAVAVAHAANIIHRDLKPANVLLDSQGLPKIADFGLAKRISLDANQTEEELLICTPCYAAPERIFEPDNQVSPAIDIYSLGAILFEMLTGRPPFVGTSILEVLEQARCGDAITPRRLVSSVPRDLETICLKCLEREPTKRYATSTELADDLGRFLEHKPVQARSISASSRLIRWVRRNPALAALCLLSSILLLGVTTASIGIASMLAKSSRAEREMRTLAMKSQELALENEQRALAEAAAANESIQLIQELFAATDIARLRPTEIEIAPDQLVVGVSTREIVELGIARLDNALRQHPLARARVLTTVGTTALNVGMVKESRPLLTEAVELYHQTKQSESLSAAEALIVLARIEAANRNYQVAIELFDRSSNLLGRLSLSNSMAQTDIEVYRAWMGLAWKNQVFVTNCLNGLDEAVELRAKYLGKHHPQSILAKTVATLAAALVTEDRVAAVQSMESLWDEIKDVPLGNFMKGIVLDQIASLYQRLDDSEKATYYIDQSLERMHLALGNHDHPILSEIHSDAAWIAHARGDIRSTRLHQEKALRMRERCLGEDSETWDLRVRLIQYLENTGEHLTAHKTSSEFPTDASTGFARKRQIAELVQEKRYDEAIPLQQAIVLDYETAEWTSMVEVTTFDLAQMELQRQNYQAARQIYDDWLVKKDRLPAHQGLSDFVVLPWDRLLEQCGDLTRAEACRKEHLEMLHRYAADLPQFHPDEWEEVYLLIMAAGDLTHTQEQLQRWHTGWLSRKYPGHVCMGALKHALALQALRAGEISSARDHIGGAISILRESLGETADRTLAAELSLARIRMAADEGTEGLTAVQALLPKHRMANGPEHPGHIQLQNQLNQLLHAAQQTNQPNQHAH